MKLFIPYIILISFLLMYSYTQVDLSLTVSRNEFLQGIVRAFQEIGYFQRPLSAFFYLTLLGGLYLFYGIFLFFAWRKKITTQYVWIIILTTVGILLFSYNAFSYDIFNYIFDAKIVTEYQQNPYEHKALDYPGDPMLSFMHWTHRVYPYGPSWLAMTVPISFLGFGYFLPTFFLFKLLMAGSFVGCLYFIGKIIRKVAPDKETVSLVFFGLQPLLLIESIVSAHLDIVMIFFALWGFLFLLQKKHMIAISLLLVSIGIKFATIFLLPVFITVWFLHKKKQKIAWGKIFFFSFIMMVCGVIAMIIGRELHPWYLVSAFSFAFFFAYRFIMLFPMSILSFFLLLSYAPYLYFGNWDFLVPQVRFWILVLGGVLSLIGVGVGMIWEKRKIGYN